MASLRKRAGKWWYTISMADGSRKEIKGTTDKRITAQMAAKAEMEVAQIKAGTLDPKDAIFRGEGAKSILLHIADWSEVMSSKGLTTDHNELSVRRVQAICGVIAGLSWKEACPSRGCTSEKRQTIYDRVEKKLDKFSFLKLTPDGIQKALGSLIASGRSKQSANHYRAALRAFVKWALDSSKLRDDPMRGVKGYNAEEDVRHLRRNLSLEEGRKLIKAAIDGPAVIQISGEDRAMAYQIALGTGFRADEIRSLTPESFRLEGVPPTILLTGAATKNGKKVTQAISPSLATRIAEWLSKKEPNQPVLPLPAHTAEMMRADLKAAGITYETKDGFADFHALRSTFITRLIEKRVDIKTVQKLARHSSPVLTLARYAKSDIYKAGAAVCELPEDIVE